MATNNSSGNSTGDSNCNTNNSDGSYGGNGNSNNRYDNGGGNHNSNSSDGSSSSDGILNNGNVWKITTTATASAIGALYQATATTMVIARVKATVMAMATAMGIVHEAQRPQRYEGQGRRINYSRTNATITCR